MKWFNRISGTLLIFVGATLIALWAFSPLISRSVINNALNDHSLTLTPTSTIRLNPFTSRLSISDLNLQREGETNFEIKGLEIEYRLIPLLSKRIEIPSITINGLSLNAEIDEDTLVIAGLDLNELSVDETPPTEAAPTETVPATESDATNPPSFAIVSDRITFNDLSIHATYQGQNHELKLDKLSLKNAQYDQKPDETFAQGRLTLKGLNYTNPDIVTKLKSYSLSLSDIELSNDFSEIQVQLKSKLEQVLITSKHSGDIVTSLESLEIEDASFEQDQSTLQLVSPTIKIVGFIASQSQDEELAPLLNLSELQIQGASFSNEHLEVNKIQIGEISSFSRLSENGLENLVLPSPPETDAPNTSDTGTSDTDTASPDENKVATNEDKIPADSDTTEPTNFSFAIHELATTANSVFRIEDATKTPELNKEFTLEELVIENIDSKNTDTETTFTTLLKDENYMRLLVKGKAQPFKEHINANIESELTEFSLPEVNGYLSEILGFEFKAGQLDSKITGDIVNSKIDSSVKLTIRGSDFSASQAPSDETNLIGQTAVPLNVALGMLKDKKGTISLNIPVRGDVEDPNFGMEYLLALVIKKAVMNQTKSYLMTTFVPYAQVVNVAMAAGSFALKVRFEDLKYSPGQIEILPEQETFVSQLSTLMNDKPKLQVKICPVTSPSDIDLSEKANAEEQKRLIDISNQRAAKFKSAIVKNGIESSRLFVCGTKIEAKEDKGPRLTFSI